MKSLRWYIIIGFMIVAQFPIAENKILNLRGMTALEYTVMFGRSGCVSGRRTNKKAYSHDTSSQTKHSNRVVHIKIDFFGIVPFTLDLHEHGVILPIPAQQQMQIMTQNHYTTQNSYSPQGKGNVSSYVAAQQVPPQKSNYHQAAYSQNNLQIPLFVRAIAKKVKKDKMSTLDRMVRCPYWPDFFMDLAIFF
ncbi:hypothetical protein RUM44_002506 [Polyplax serrata]|uniref:Uncharacterized protein n=1 Tax=Polyplax serrata TaxID=468196 RepID=A0ABR1AEZ0_POLSC